MSRTSPGVGRVVAVLNFFADHPGQAFTLTDLVRALRLSRATCHALLVGLVDAGYLYRASDKSYVLGPALAAIGEAAAASASPLRVAQPEMRALADRYDAICSACFREGTDVVVRERAASLSHLGHSVARGTRLPLRPTFAAPFFAWSPAADTEAWLDALSPPPSAALRAETHHAMAFGREHGFFFGTRTVPGDPARLDLDAVLDDAVPHIPVAMATRLDPHAEYGLTTMIVPVFGARGETAFVLALMGVAGPLRGEQVAAMGHDMRAACRRIARFLGGGEPASR